MKLSRNARTHATCIRCGENRKPVIRVMKADGQTAEKYICSSCRAEAGRKQMKSGSK